MEGIPLHYYPYSIEYSSDYIYDQFYPSTMQVCEDIMPASPSNSLQSDSDNSLSSVEMSPKRINTRNSSEEFRCRWRSCDDLFESLDQLANHISKEHATSGPGGLFYCCWEGCSRNSKGFNARYKMLVHVRTHTNEKPHRCFQCEKSFSRAENLKIHSRSHSGEKPYICPVPGCKKAYSNSSDRFKHTRTHQDEKPYQCKIPGCSKRYTDPSSLRKHVKTFKHFANDKATSEIENREFIATVPIEHEGENRLCDYANSCYADRKVDEIFHYKALGNIRQDMEWQRSFVSEKDIIFESYTTQSPELEDLPLDLTIHRKVV